MCNTNKSETEKLVVVLDTGAAQTVLLKGVLLLIDDKDSHKSVLVECVRHTGYQYVTLGRVYLKSKYDRVCDSLHG